MSQPSIPPLPPELEQGAKDLRDRQLSADFTTRLERALEQRAAAPSRPSSSSLSSSLWAGLAVVVPALTAAVLVLHLSVGDEALQSTAPLSRFEEHHVVLDEAGHAWVELDLWTHHHEGAASVRVDTPASVHVDEVDGADRECGPLRCTHHFVATRPRSPLRVWVSEPGRHSITVEHTSPSQRVREQFLVHAR